MKIRLAWLAVAGVASVACLTAPNADAGARCASPAPFCIQDLRAGNGNGYLACDDADEPDYPSLRIAPRSCSLGLEASPYDAQPVPGHRRPHAVALKDLKWQRWGHRSARAHGRVCDVYSGRCDQARVVVSKLRRVLPAGNVPIYQLIRVRHFRHGGGSYTDWYQPGTDY